MNEAMPSATALDADALRLIGLFTPSMLAEELKKEPQQFVIEGLIAERSCNLLVGDNGIGKTPFLVAEGVAVASGRPFLERAVNQGPVVYFDAEMGRDQFLELLETVSGHMGLPAPPKDFLVWSSNWSNVEGNGGGFSRTRMSSIVERVKPSLVIVDPIHRFWERHPEGRAVDMLRFQRELSRKHGCAWQNLHHRRKTNQNAMSRPDLVDDPRGWLQESSGNYSLVNHHDTRIGLEATRRHEAYLIVGGIARGEGPIAPLYLLRAYVANDEPVGYAVLSGLTLLSPEHQTASSVASPFGSQMCIPLWPQTGPSNRCIDLLTQAKVITKEGEHKKTLYRCCRSSAERNHRSVSLGERRHPHGAHLTPPLKTSRVASGRGH